MGIGVRGLELLAIYNLITYTNITSVYADLHVRETLWNRVDRGKDVL